MAFVSEDGGNDAEDNRHQIKSDIAYRSQQFSQLAGSTHATSLVYLVVATDQWYLHEVTTTVLEESGAKYVICASIEDILVSDVVRKDIYERETSGRQSPLYVINNVGSVQGNTTQNLAAMDFLHTSLRLSHTEAIHTLCSTSPSRHTTPTSSQAATMVRCASSLQNDARLFVSSRAT